MKMDCQSRSKTERDVQSLDTEKPIEWIDPVPPTSPQSLLSPSENQHTGAHQITDLPVSLVALERSLTQALLANRNTQEALFNFAQLIGEAFAVDCCLILPQDRGTPQAIEQTFQQVYSYIVSPFQYSEQLLTLFSHPRIQANLPTTETIAVDDLQALSQLTASFRQSSDKGASPPTAQSRQAPGNSSPPPSAIPSQVRSVLIQNTQYQGRINGTVILIRSQPYDWKETDVQQLQSLSPHVAVALSQNQLERQMEQQARYQNLVNQLTAAIRNSWELEQIFQLAVEGATSALQCSRGLVFLLKYSDPMYKSRSRGIPEAKVNVVADWFEPFPERLQMQTEPLGDRTIWASTCCLCRQVLTSSEPIAITSYMDWDNREIEGKTPAPFFALDRFPALLLAPLENQGTVLGCLVLQHHQHRIWEPEEIAFVKLVAAQLSTAIIQVRTLQHVQALVQERTAQLQRSLDVQAKLYEKTRQQVEQLRRLHEEREEFLSTVSHELRTPLTSMTLAIRMLRQADLSVERRTRYLDILEQQCVQETQLINDLLDLRKLESTTTTAPLQKLDIRYLIRNTAQSIAETLAERNLSLELDLPTKPLNLYTEPDSLSRILMELLTNARKYADSDSVIQLQVSYDPTQPMNQVVIALRNIGAGILPDELPYIFDKFRRGRGVTQQAIQGTGLGLALVKRLVEYLGGTIGASSQPLEQSSSWQTCFTVTLPQCPEGLMQGMT
ncbi:GAF domain-containing sensor histidine kinase [Egbenema bharatensis]|uniref:GAF domain-containing sensor histidine kinase n=1 Tax=Egbenema bharatensis TaxID=3463334 RepID=UPI003A859249